MTSKRRMAADQLLDPRRKTLRRGRPDLQPEAAQNPAQAHLHIVKLRLHQLARRQERPHLLRRHRLAMHRTEPAKPHQLGNARARRCGRSSPASP